jgi:hypothetical protein
MVSTPTHIKRNGTSLNTDKILKLEAYLLELSSARAEFEHQARRYTDAYERAGGVLPGIDSDVRQLNENMADNEAEQTRVKGQIEN